MLSSLSSVPPVWPSPRPEIIGTAPPHAATSGASTSETLSPTPPVECLSSTGAAPAPPPAGRVLVEHRALLGRPVEHRARVAHRQRQGDRLLLGEPTLEDGHRPG